MRPARALVFAIVPLLAVALFAPAGAFHVLLGLTFLAVLVDGLRARRARVEVGAASAPTRLGLGEAGALDLELRGTGRGPRRLRLALDLPAALAPQPLIDEWAGTLQGASSQQLRFGLFGERRGRHAVGELHLERLGPWKLAWGRQRRALDLPEVLVVPGFREAAQTLRMDALRSSEVGSRRSTLPGPQGSFESLRAYQRGDDPRLVSWKASARHGELLVRRHEEERHQTVIVCVDAGRAMAESGSGHQRVDAALGAAVALTASARHWDDRVGLIVFAEQPTLTLPPARYTAAQLAELVAECDAQPVESHYERFASALQSMQRRRALVVIFGDLVDVTVSSSLLLVLKRLSKRHLVLFVAMRHEGLEREAWSDTSGGAHAWREAAAAELLLERQAALREARAQGVVVVEAPTSRAALAAVEAYRAIKLRRRL